MNKRKIGLPESYEPLLEQELRKIGYSLGEPGKIARAVQKLSDFYLANPEGQTPWREAFAQAASLAYYFPLNYARNRSVADEAARLGFYEGLDSLFDIGCGTGSGILAFMDRAKQSGRKFQHALAQDLSDDAVRLCEALAHGAEHALKSRHLSVEETRELPSKQTLVIASYVYTELAQAPDWWRHAEALAIIEPSTQSDARRLQAFRKDLLAWGFSLWAPCTHEGDCPLLLHSQKDWCHDRIHWAAPQWFMQIEKQLPMKNRTLTFSYILARRSRRPQESLNRFARLIGDTLEEKGKNRQAVCRNSDREFFAWFPQRFPKGSRAIELERGNLVQFSGEEKRGSEIRLPSAEAIEELPPSAPVP